MSPKKRTAAEGFITFHTPFPRDLFVSENYTIDSQIDVTIMKSPSQPSVRSNLNTKSKREKSNEDHKSTRARQPLKLDKCSCSSIRRLQTKMETENHQMKETMEHLLKTENGFVKELEDVLNLHDTTELRRRELLHKHWTERLWLPLQKHLNQRVSSYGAIDIKRRQGLYSQYLQHYNNKGYVFLDTYNPKEYDPFLHHLKKSHYVKLAQMDIPKEAWMSTSLETDSKTSSRQENKLPHHFQSSLVSNSSVTPATPLGTPLSYSPSTSTKTPEKEAVRRAPSRLDKIPCHIDTKYRNCYRRDCWSSPGRYGL